MAEENPSKHIHSELSPQEQYLKNVTTMRTLLNEVIGEHNLDTVHKDLQDIKDSLNHVYVIAEEAKKPSQYQQTGNCRFEK